MKMTINRLFSWSALALAASELGFGTSCEVAKRGVGESADHAYSRTQYMTPGRPASLAKNLRQATAKKTAPFITYYLILPQRAPQNPQNCSVFGCYTSFDNYSAHVTRAAIEVVSLVVVGHTFIVLLWQLTID